MPLHTFVHVGYQNTGQKTNFDSAIASTYKGKTKVNMSWRLNCDLRQFKEQSTQIVHFWQGFHVWIICIDDKDSTKVTCIRQETCKKILKNSRNITLSDTTVKGLHLHKSNRCHSVHEVSLGLMMMWRDEYRAIIQLQVHLECNHCCLSLIMILSQIKVRGNNLNLHANKYVSIQPSTFWVSDATMLFESWVKILM